MIFLLTGLVISLLGLYDFKKGFIWFLAFKLLLVTNITVVSEPGLPLLTLELLLTIIFAVLFFVKGVKVQNAHMSFPIIVPFSFYVISLVLSSLFSISGFASESSNLIKVIFEDVLLVWIARQTIETEKDFSCLFRIITIIIFASCIYGLFEFVISDNPLKVFEATLNHDPDKLIDFSYDVSGRGYRISSIFEHPIGAGMTWAMYSSLVFYLFVKKNIKFKKIIFPLITAFICLPCILLTKMRSPLIFLIISLFASIRLNSKRFYGLLFIFLVGIVFIFFFFSDDIINVILALFNNDNAMQIGGSSLTMRIDQFDAAFNLMQEAPIFGLGPSFNEVMENALTIRLLGAESIWLNVITQQGLFGIITYCILLFYLIIILPKKMDRNISFFIFSFAFWLTYTITSLPGFDIVFYYLLVIYMIKSSKCYDKKVKAGFVYFLGFYKSSLLHGKIKKRGIVKRNGKI